MKASALATGLLIALAWTPAFGASDGGVTQAPPKAPSVKPIPAKYTTEKKVAPSADTAKVSAKEPKKKQGLLDSQIRKILIQESIDAYPGNCPCPDNVDRRGSRCGKRSAHDRPGGYAPLCFEKDVSADAVQQYRDTHKSEGE